MDYETGVIVAALLWLYGAVLHFTEERSLMNRNLRKIGYRFSWHAGKIVEMPSKDQNRTFAGWILRVVLFQGFSFLFVLLSWVMVIYAIGYVVYRLSKDFGAP
jgi:hypothetical protein